MIVVAIIGVLAAIAIPQYQNYIARAQVARVMSETGSLRTSIEVCVNEGRTETTGTGANVCTVGATKSNLLSSTGTAAGLPSVTLPTTSTATSTIVATFGDAASAAIASKTLTWTRDSDGAWTCTTTVDAKYQPRGCGAATK